MVLKGFGNLIVAMPRKDRRTVVNASARWTILLQAFRNVLSATPSTQLKTHGLNSVVKMSLHYVRRTYDAYTWEAT